MLRCESVPNDGPTVIGGSSLEEFTVTGESLPVVKGVVALVFAEKITVFNEQGIAAADSCYTPQPESRDCFGPVSSYWS